MSELSLGVITVAVLVPSVIFHEVAHAFAASVFGDDTAERAGRLSLNPIRHVDPVGTLAVPLLLVLFSPFVVAWAKPVPVLTSRLRHPRVHSLFVALAGPATNFSLAGLAIGVFRVFRPADESVLWWVLALTVFLNVVLGAFNLLPVPPLDGSAIIEFALPRSALGWWYRVRPYTVVFIVALVVLGRGLLEPVFDWAIELWRSQQ